MRVKLLKKEVLPWESFEENARFSLDQVIVSHRKKSKKEGQLHNETAYGFSSKGQDFSKPVEVVHYVDILSLVQFDKRKKFEKIISGRIKSDLLREWMERGRLSKEFLEGYHKKTGVRRVRVKEKEKVIPITNRSGKAYKAFIGDGNYAMELSEKPNGKWDGRVITRFEANNKSFISVPENRKLVIGDMLFFDNKFWRVVKLSDNNITFAEHFEANVDARNRKKQYQYTTKTPGSLQSLKPGRVDVSPCGVFRITPFDFEEIKERKEPVQQIGEQLANI